MQASKNYIQEDCSRPEIVNKFSSHSISPAEVLRGEQAWEKGVRLIPSLCQSPLIVGRSKATKTIRESINKSLFGLNLQPTMAELMNDCCERDLQRIYSFAKEKCCDGIIAAGGGKVLDSGKLLAQRLKVPCITVPLSASTCAGWTALANIYTPEGAFQHDEVLESCPNLIIFDHNFVRQAPSRTLASGIADALAKWYEASLSTYSSSDGLIQQAVQMARVLRDQLLIDGQEAINNPMSDEWIRVAEGCALTAGLIGGIGGARCRTAAAHATHNGLTQLSASQEALHGEIVGFGILVQLRLEEIITSNQLAKQSRLQLLPFLQKLALPTTLEEIGLKDITIHELSKACNFACKKDSEIHHLPFKVNSNSLMEALIGASQEGLIKNNHIHESTIRN